MAGHSWTISTAAKIAAEPAHWALVSRSPRSQTPKSAAKGASVEKMIAASDAWVWRCA